MSVRRCALAALAAALSAAPARSAWEPVGGAASGTGVSRRPALSDDGRRLVFESTARLSPDDTDRRPDIYVVDLPGGAPRRLPRAAKAPGVGGAAISGDGKWAAYHVLERAGTTEVEPQAVVILYNLAESEARRIPPAWWGKSAAAEALFPALGRSGRAVAFTSNATGLAVKRKVPVRGVFVYEPPTDQIRLVSRGPNRTPANRPSAEPRISHDARHIAFLSVATNLEPRLPADSLETHLYLADRWERTLTRLDTIERGFTSKDWLVGRFDMDDDARHLVFEARARAAGKPMATLSTTDLFLFETSSGAVTRLTTGLFSGRSHSPAISGNGRWVAFVYSGAQGDKGGVVVYDRVRDSWRRVVDANCGNPCISGDGRWIAFESADPAVTGEKGARSRVFVTENPSFEAEEEQPADAGD